MDAWKPLSVVYYALALDPIHVGTGGYRLGEVDLTILREPGSNLPKIPGSSLAGAARAYTAMTAPGNKYRRLKPGFDAQNQTIVAAEASTAQPTARPAYISCAGKGGEDGSEHCGEIDCPVCVTYGFTIGPQNRSFHGMAQFYDAQILFFPVHTLAGPVWVTSPGALEGAGYALPAGSGVQREQVRTVAGLVPQTPGRRWGLNVGWLFLDVVGADLDAAAIWTTLALPGSVERIKGRLALVSDDLFDLVVNSNLELRTSVSIDPATGAAEEGALFTYEALPRGTLLYFPAVYQNPQHYVFPAYDGRQVQPTPFPASTDEQWVRGHVAAGLALMEHLGVGGMNTRGFGRLRILNPGAGGPAGGK